MTNSLKDFMISKTRVKMFELFFANTDEMYYVREITRHTKEEINAVRRELDRMLGYGLVRSEQRGNRVYYSLNKRYVFFDEIQKMVAKTTGIGKKIRRLRRKLGEIEYVMFSSKFVKGVKPNRDEVDLLVIGNIVLPELEAIVKEEEAKIGREVNYAVFDLQEFEFRKTRRDPFIMDILMNSRVMIIGSGSEFAERKMPGIN
ncbi:MAG: winged helix-turn-helix domain-containing protein [Candidatus Pacebacteria bacterium]|nr:winged helix-turn-helix domain-containing protein [Candidatus Paceibacterota bacterium]